MKKRSALSVFLLFCVFTAHARRITEKDCLTVLSEIVCDYYIKTKKMPETMEDLKDFNSYTNPDSIKQIDFYEEIFPIVLEKTFLGLAI